MALSGALCAGYVWLLLDGLRGMRVLAWLKADAVSELRLGSGIWGEVYDRVRRLLRVSQRQRQESDARLQDFLAALQASPNGVVLLDAEMRMEWFNHTAAVHFGFDLQRDVLQHFGNLVRVHSRGQLLDKVWGDHVYIEERTVDVHVKRLREALLRAGPMVETVRGVGYRLTAHPVVAVHTAAASNG